MYFVYTNTLESGDKSDLFLQKLPFTVGNVFDASSLMFVTKQTNEQTDKTRNKANKNMSKTKLNLNCCYMLFDETHFS